MSEEQKRPEEVAPHPEENLFKKVITITVGIMLVALIFMALVTFFFSMLSSISAFFQPQYVPLITAIFSLVVIGIGVYLVKMFLSK